MKLNAPSEIVKHKCAADACPGDVVRHRLPRLFERTNLLCIFTSIAVADEIDKKCVRSLHIDAEFAARLSIEK